MNEYYCSNCGDKITHIFRIDNDEYYGYNGICDKCNYIIEISKTYYKDENNSFTKTI